MQEKQLVTIENIFDGHNITTILYKDRPCWIAKEIGNVLGYSDRGGRLVVNLFDDWNDEFIGEKDYVKLIGQELVEFKELLQTTSINVGSLKHAPHLTLLFESGVNMAETKSIGQLPTD